MPLMNGAETSREIRAIYEKQGVFAPFIAGISGDQDDETKKECEEAGMNRLCMISL